MTPLAFPADELEAIRAALWAKLEAMRAAEDWEAYAATLAAYTRIIYRQAGLE